MLSIEEIRTKARQWLGPEFNEETRKEVGEMLDNDEKKLIDAFYQDLEFGTGGLRGIMGAGTNRMKVDACRRLRAVKTWNKRLDQEPK